VCGGELNCEKEEPVSARLCVARRTSSVTNQQSTKKVHFTSLICAVDFHSCYVKLFTHIKFFRRWLISSNKSTHDWLNWRGILRKLLSSSLGIFCSRRYLHITFTQFIVFTRRSWRQKGTPILVGG
jgi:hypothetical protein